jgi:hypothetical protein
MAEAKLDHKQLKRLHAQDVSRQTIINLAVARVQYLRVVTRIYVIVGRRQRAIRLSRRQ